MVVVFDSPPFCIGLLPPSPSGNPILSYFFLFPTS